MRLKRRRRGGEEEKGERGFKRQELLVAVLGVPILAPQQGQVPPAERSRTCHVLRAPRLTGWIPLSVSSVAVQPHTCTLQSSRNVDITALQYDNNRIPATEHR